MKRDNIYTDTQTDGHRDSMIESAKWADSMKILIVNNNIFAKVYRDGGRGVRVHRYFRSNLLILKQGTCCDILIVCELNHYY